MKITKDLVVVLLSLALPIGFSTALIVKGVDNPADMETEPLNTTLCTPCTVPDDTLPVLTTVTQNVTEVTDVTEVTTITEVTEAPKRYYDCPLSHDLQDYIRELCDENGVPMSLIIAMIDVESSFTANVISDTNDYGLMQINKINHDQLSEKYGITNFLDPYQNVQGGIVIIAQHYNNYQDVDKALMAYNLGVGGAKRYWNNGIYQTSYSQKIQSVKEVYDNEI